MCIKVPKTRIPTYVLRLQYFLYIVYGRVSHCRTLTVLKVSVFRICLKLEEKEIREGGENFMMRSTIIYTLRQILFG
jgi:hypothetical protein